MPFANGRKAKQILHHRWKSNAFQSLELRDKMPYALSTTKRKFNRILDTISNASNPSLNSIDNQPPAVKKPRLTRPAVLVESCANHFRSTSTGTTMADEHNKPPNFAPWDRMQFLQRLETFRYVDKWMGKPEKVNEVQWARRGWSCVGKERVGCVGGCGKEAVIKLEEDGTANGDSGDELPADAEDQGQWRESAQDELIMKYAEIIITGHEINCLWRRRGYDDTIYRLPLAHQGTALNNLRLRYESLLAISTELPSSLSTPEVFTLLASHDHLCRLLYPPATPSANITHTKSSTSTTQYIENKALTLALFGWQAEPSPIPALATCSACFRRLGLWLFKPSPESTSSSMSRLDVVAEHRDYCPWVNAESQSLTPIHEHKQAPRSSISDEAGWEVLVRMINNTVPAERRSTIPTLATDSTMAAAGGASEVGSLLGEVTDNTARDALDRERWARLKKLKQVFQIKRGKAKGTSDMERALNQRATTGKENLRINSPGQ